MLIFTAGISSPVHANGFINSPLTCAAVAIPLTFWMSGSVKKFPASCYRFLNKCNLLKINKNNNDCEELNSVGLSIVASVNALLYILIVKFFTSLSFRYHTAYNSKAGIENEDCGLERRAGVVIKKARYIKNGIYIKK